MFKKILISSVIIAYLYCALIMAFPRSWSFKACLFKPLSPVLSYLGLEYYLLFFGPNPPAGDRRIEFLVQCSDGSWVSWKYSRRQLAFWDPPDTFQRNVENYLWWGRRYTVLFPDFARFIARQVHCPASASAGQRPSLVKFVAYEAITPPLNEAHPISTVPRRLVFFRYHVAPSDLQ